MPAEDDVTMRAFAELRADVEARLAEERPDWDAVDQARDEAERFWPVTAEREALVRPGRGGRVRGLLLAPVRTVLRPLLRWYVEPALADQRRFNAAVLRVLDELIGEARREPRG